MNLAVAEFQTAIRLQPKFAEAHYNLAAAWLELGDHSAEAQQELEIFLQIQPDNLNARQTLTALRSSKITR